MDGRTYVGMGCINETAGAIVGNDRFHGHGRTEQEARQTMRAARETDGHCLGRLPLLDEEVSSEQLEMLERIRVAAGQTS